MKQLIIALCLFASSVVSAQTTDPVSAVSIALTVGGWITKDSKKVYYVRVESTGDDIESARHGGFRKAVELAVGTLVLGESESDGKRMLRNDVVTYSSGYVEDFKVISNGPVGNKTRVVMDVWVSDSKIANRLSSMGQSTGAAVNGAAIKRDYEIDAARAATEETRRRNGMTVTDMVLADYPRRATKTAVTKTWVGRNKEGAVIFNIETVTEFTQEYLEAAAEVLTQTRQGSSSSQRYPTGVKVYTGVFGNTKGYYVNSSVKDKWEIALSKEVKMRIVYTDTTPHVLCYSATKHVNGILTGYEPRLDGYTGHNMDTFVVDNKRVNTVYGIHSNPAKTPTEAQFVDWLSKITKVEAQLVDADKCK
jgi:hypothetical protein